MKQSSSNRTPVHHILNLIWLPLWDLLASHAQIPVKAQPVESLIPTHPFFYFNNCFPFRSLHLTLYIFSKKMLIAVGPPRWSQDHHLIGHSHSRASSISLQNSTSALRLGAQVKRNVSNPFDILYHPESGHSSGNSRDESIPKDVSELTPYKTASYLQIERDIHAGHSPARSSGISRNLGSLPPVVTVIDEKLKRGNLIISRLASLRLRNSIRRRNKMVRKTDLDAEKSPLVFSVASSKKKRKSRLSFVFPIKRRTLFKYRPVLLLPSLRFRSQKDVDEYFVYNNIASLMKDVVPRTMMTYDYSSIVKIEPQLRQSTQQFAISRASDFTMVTTPKTTLHRFSLLQGEKLVEPVHPLSLAKTPSETVSQVEKRQIFISTVYAKYKDQVFAGKHQVPPRLDQVMPFEADMLAPEEKVAIDTKLALEVLLRRTLAAKIDYRLKKSGVGLAPVSSRSGDLTLGGNSLSSSDSANYQSKEYRPKRYRPHKDNLSKSHDTESFDTDQFMKQSLLSEVLPSPQVSFALKIFDFDQISVRDLDPKKQAEKMSQRGSRTNSVRNSRMNSAKNSRKNSLKESLKHSKKSGSPEYMVNPLTPGYNTPGAPLSTSSIYSGERFSRQSSMRASLAVSEMFVNDFNKFYYESERKKAESEYKSLSNINLYSFQPLNRSSHTISTLSVPSGQNATSNSENLTGDLTGNLSGDLSGNLSSNFSGNLSGNLTGNSTENIESSYDSTNSGNKLRELGTLGTLGERSSLSFTSSYPRQKRDSKSTTDTSVMHSLDNLADSVNEYLLSEGGPDLADETPTPGKLNASSVYTDSINQLGLDVTYGIPSPRDSISPHNAAANASANASAYPDITQQFSLESIVQNLQKEKEYDQGLLNINYSASPKMVEESRSFEKELMSFQGSVHGGQTEVSFSRQSNSGSDDSSISPLRTMRSEVMELRR